MQIERFEMERTQCLYENVVDLNLSESGVLPLRADELVDTADDRERFLANSLLYCESDGSHVLRERIARFYPDCEAENVTVTNGGAEANYVTLWALLGRENRLACMLPNYLQGWGLGRAYASAADAFHLTVVRSAASAGGRSTSIRSIAQRRRRRRSCSSRTRTTRPAQSERSGDGRGRRRRTAGRRLARGG